VAWLSLVAAGLVVLFIVGVFFLNQRSRGYVVNFEGQRIDTVDLQFLDVLAMLSGDPTPPMDTLITYLLLEQRAQQHNIILTQEERTDLDELAVELRQMVESFAAMGLITNLPAITNARMSELLSMNLLSERLMEIYAADVTVDEDTLIRELADFRAFNRSQYIDMELKYIISPTILQSQDAWEDLNNANSPDDFEAIIIDYMARNGHPIDNPEFGIDRIPLMELHHIPGIASVTIEMLAHLQPGDFTEPLPFDDSFIIFIVDEVSIPSDAEIEETFRENYIWMQRQMIFAGHLAQWREAADIRINERGVNAA
jgi:hypothetical protein